jgi:penicillin amidase
MKRIFLPAFLFVIWITFLSIDIPVGENFLPSLGRFLNPFQGIWQSVKSSNKSFTFQGKTKHPVKILFDERDVPHIYAETIEDAIYAQGYLHASNRLFAMDITTRAAAGRLSELLGKRTAAYDHKQRKEALNGPPLRKQIIGKTLKAIKP